MGSVYRAKELTSGRFVALKVLLQKEQLSFADKEAVLRLRDESLATGAVEHHGLVKIISSGEIETFGPYLVYELIEGGNLHEYLAQNGPLSFDEMMKDLAQHVLGALMALHKKGILHRDIKAENILRRKDGSFLLGDLGLAYFEGREAKTKTGLIVGTPGFIAPECILATAEKPSTSADVYSAAMLLCYAMTGKLPIDGQSPHELIFAQIKGDIPAKKLRALGLSAPLSDVLARALKIDPQERIASAEELLEELSRLSQTSEQTTLTKALPGKEEKTKSSFPLVIVFALLLITFCLCGHHFLKKPTELFALKIATDGSSIRASWQGQSPIKVELRDPKGRKIFQGPSLANGANRQYIEIDKLTPYTKYTLQLAKNGPIELTTKETKITSHVWSAMAHKNLYFSGEVNSQKPKLRLVISDGKNEQELLWRGRPEIFEGILDGESKSVSWALHSPKKLLGRGRIWRQDSLKTALLWSCHRTSCLLWLKDYLVAGNTKKGIAFISPNPNCTKPNEFWRAKKFRTNVDRNQDYHYFWPLGSHQFLCFGFRNNSDVSLSKFDLSGEPQMVGESKQLQLSGHFSAEEPPIRYGNKLIFLGKRDTQIAWAIFDLKNMNFAPLIAIPLGEELPRDYDKELPWLDELGFRLHRMRIHGSPVLRNNELYSLGTLAADNDKGLVAVLLSLSLNKLDSPDCYQRLAQTNVIAGDQQMWKEDDDKLCFTGKKDLFCYQKGRLESLGQLTDENSYLASSAVYIGAKAFAFAGLVNREKKSKAAVITTVTIHLATSKKDGTLHLHKEPLAYVEVFPGGRLPRVRDLSLYKGRYLLASMMGNCTVVDLQTGRFDTIAHRRRVEEFALAPNGLWAAYLNNSDIMYSQVDLQMMTAKKRVFRINDFD